MVSSNGRRKVEVGDSTIFPDVETSTHDTDFGIAGGILELEEDLGLRRLVDILRQSLPSDIERTEHLLSLLQRSDWFCWFDTQER
jgi:hypothetical protein